MSFKTGFYIGRYDAQLWREDKIWIRLYKRTIVPCASTRSNC